MTSRAAFIERLWYFDIWWRLNWRDVDATYLGRDSKQAWSA